MTYGMYEAAAREAERLRTIITTLAYAHPGMSMDEAVPIILAAEKRTAELDAPKMPKEIAYPILKDKLPGTGAAYIDLCPSIQEPILDGKMIDGIKEFRRLTGWGLKESKEACEMWRSGHSPATPSPTMSVAPAWIADWIDGQPHIQDMITGSGAYAGRTSTKIHAIKEVRATCPSYPGLKEAKEGVEEWARTRVTP